MNIRKNRLRAALAALLLAGTCLTVGVAGAVPAHAVSVDGTCTGSVTLTFSPPATEPLPPSSGPATTSTGAGTITTCVFPGGGATTGTFTYALTGNLTCTTAQNVTGTLDIAWADATTSHATVTSLIPGLGTAGGAAALDATITTGRFTGDQITLAAPPASPSPPRFRICS